MYLPVNVHSLAHEVTYMVESFMMVLMIQPDIANILILLIHQKSIFLVGVRVLSNPEIALCESGMERYTAESELVVNDTTSERNGTCSMCGKPCSKKGS